MRSMMCICENLSFLQPVAEYLFSGMLRLVVWSAVSDAAEDPSAFMLTNLSNVCKYLPVVTTDQPRLLEHSMVVSSSKWPDLL